MKPNFILTRPQMGENIGAAARVMWNFGLEGLRLVAPRDGWPNKKAATVSSGGGQILDKCLIHPTVEDAVDDLNFVFATTIRSRKFSKEVFNPFEGMKLIKELVEKGQSTGVIFGSERAGLESKEIAIANAIISIPVNTKFRSLNLSHAVALLAYEWFRISGDEKFTTKDPNDHIKNATQSEVNSLINHLKIELNHSGYFWPEGKRDSLNRNIENLFHRMPLTNPDIRTLFGIIKAISKRRNSL